MKIQVSLIMSFRTFNGTVGGVWFRFKVERE